MQTKLLFIAILASVVSSCARSSTPLPQSWYRPQSSDDVRPSAETDEAVRNVFRAHALALTSVPVPTAQEGWHLDGMLAEFGISVNGIFGALLYNGTSTVRGTWQRAGAALGPAQAKTPNLRLNAQMTSQDLANRLEPIVKTSVASGTIRDENRFRGNLFHQSEMFRQLGLALSAIPVSPGWHVGGVQLQLTFDSSGNVTAFTNVGGAINLFLDWQSTEETTSPNPALTQSLSELTRTVASIIPEALNDSPDLQKSGFLLDQFQLGIALSAQGTIGVAQAQAVATGKLIFVKDNSPAAGVSSSPVISTVGPDGALSWIDRAHFEKGLSRSLKLASYFAARAVEADTASWKITKLEAEFDTSAGGTIGLATVDGTGQMVLDLDRIGGST